MDEIEKERRAGRRARYQAEHFSPDQPLMSQGILGALETSSDGLEKLISSTFRALSDRQLLRSWEIWARRGGAIPLGLKAILDERGLSPEDFEVNGLSDE